jgi:hypothetical protein
MDYSKVCRKRKINIIDTSTPLLVPSFSSKGFKDIKNLYIYMKEYMSEVSLISAYDLYYDFINSKQIYETEVIFIDSGGYERDQEHDLSDVYGAKYLPNQWNSKLHQEVINEIEPLADIVIVNFDFVKRYPIIEQIEKASFLFDRFPNFASNFLVKPETGEQINIENYCSNIKLLSNFSILGFTEKELGQSVLERCTNIYKIRLALNSANLNTPIHIFGCIDPLNILVYYLCGADIFDGLSWLRFSFQNNIPRYINHNAIATGKWSLTNDEIRVLTYYENLEILKSLKMQMNDFTNNYNLDYLFEDKSLRDQVEKLFLSVDEVIKGG